MGSVLSLLVLLTSPAMHTIYSLNPKALAVNSTLTSQTNKIKSGIDNEIMALEKVGLMLDSSGKYKEAIKY